MNFKSRKGSSLGLLLYIITNCVGDSYIVADSMFSQWFYAIPRDSAQFVKIRVLFNICGHHELPFDLHDVAEFSLWVDALPNYFVLVTSSLPKWASFGEGLRVANFRRL